jgi:TnpA family transposase
VNEVLEILNDYPLKWLVPEETVAMLEKLFTVYDFAEKVFHVLKNIVGRMVVSQKTLTVISDYLYTTGNSCQRFDSFKLLEIASHIQELPDKVFHQFELAKAGYALQTVSRLNLKKESIFQFIEKMVEMGVPISTDLQDALKLKWKMLLF